MLKDLEATCESIMSTNDAYQNAASKIIVRDTSVQALNEAAEQELITKTKWSKKGFNCGKEAHFGRDCRQQKLAVVPTMIRRSGGGMHVFHMQQDRSYR